DVFNEEYIYDMDDSYIYEEDVDKDVEVEELDGVEEPELKLISKLYLNKNGDPFVSEIGSDGTPKKLSYIKVPWTKVVGFSGEELGDGEDVYPSSIRTSKDFYREVDKFECEDDKNTDLWVQLNGEYKQVRTEGKLDASYEYAGGNVLRHTDVSKNTNDYVAYTKVTKLKKLEGSPIYEYSICKYDSNENYAELYNFNGKTFEPTTKEKVKRLKVSAYGNLIEDEKGDYVYCSSKPRMLDGRIRYLHTEDLFEFCKYKSELKIKTIEKNAELINCSTGNRINLKKENQTEYRIPYSVQFNESSYDYLVRTAAKNGEFLFYERSKNRENKNGIFIWGLDTTSDAPKDVDVSKYMYVEKNQTNQAYTYSDSIGRNSVPKHSPIEVDSKDVESKTTLQRPIYLTKYNGKEDDLGSGVLSVQFSSNVSDDSSVSVYRNYSKTTCLLKGGNKKGFNPVKVNEKGSELGGQILPFVSSCPNYKKELPFYKENGEYSFKKHATFRCAGSTTNDFQLIELDEKRAGRGRNFNIVVSELAYDEYNELFYPINPKSKGYDSTKSFRDDNGDVKSAFRDNGKDITKNNRGTSFGFFPNFDLWGDSMVGRGMTIAIMCLYGSPALLTLKTLNNKFDSMIFGKDYKYMYDDSYCTKQKVGGEEYKTYYSSMKKKDDKLTIHMLDFAFWCTFVKSILNAKDFVTGLMTSFSSTLIKQHIDAKISYKAGQDIWWEHEKGNGVNYVDTEATSNGMSPKSMETNQNFEECREGCLSSYQNRVKVVLFEDGSAESELRLGSIVSLSKIMGITPGSDKDKCYVVSEISGGHYNKRVVEKKDIDKNPIIHELILTPCELNKGKTDYIAYPPVSPDMELVRKSGPQSAFVVENYDPSLYNRVRVIYPWQAKFRNLPAGVNNNGQVSAKVVPYLNDVFGENLETLGYDKQNPIKGLQYGKYFRPGRYNRWGDPAQRDMGEATPFIRCTVPKAGNSAGFNIVPDVGSEVMVDYVGGNIERPFVIGGVYSADSMNFMAGSPTIMTIMSTSGHSIRFYDSPEGSLSIWKNMCPIFNSFGAFASPTMSNITSGGQKGLIYGYERCGGSLQITDGLMYTITCSTDSRGITIEAPFGSVDINSLQGVSINCPNGDVSINAKNISLTAGNNISLSSGNNIGKSMFLPTKSLLEGASGNRGLNHVDNAIGSVLNLAKDVAVSVAKSKLQLIDFSLLRCLLEIIFKPVEGTLSISAGRYLVLTAGGGKSPLNAPGFKPDSTLRNGKMNMLKGLFVNNPEIDAQAQTGDNALLTILNNVDTIFKNKRTSCETKYINRMREIKEEYDRAVQGNGDVTDMEKKLHELLYKRADNVKNTTNSLIDKLNKDMSGFAKSINALLGSSYQTILDDVAKCKEAKEKVFYKYNDGTYIKLKVRDRIKYVKLDSFKEFNIFLHGYTIKKNSTGETYNELNVVRSEKPFGENKFIKALTAYEIYKKPDDNLENGFFDKLDQDVKDMIKYGFDKEIYKEFEELLKKEKESRKEIGEDIEFDERAKNVVHGKNCVYKLVPDSGGSMKLVGSISVLPVTDFFEGLKKIFDEFVDFIKYLKKLSDDLVLLKDVDKVSLKNLENVQYIKCGSDNDKDTSSLEALAEEIKKAKEKNKEECENRDKKMKEKLEEASNTIVRELSTEVSKNDLNNTLFLGADDNNWVSTLKKKNVDKEKSGSTIPDYIKGIFYDGNNVTDLYKKAMTENLKESGENLYYVRVIMLKIMRAFYVTRYNDCLGGIVGNITSSGIGKAVSTSKRRKYSFFESEEAWALFEKAPGDKKSTEYTAYKKRANDFRKVESTFLEFLENNNWKKAQIDNGKMDFDGETSDDFISNFNSAWPKYVASISVQDPKQTGLLGSKTFSVLSGVVAGDDGSLLGGDIAKVLGIDAMRGFLSQNVWDKGQKGGVLMTIDKSSKQFDSDKGSWEDLKFEYDKYRIQDIRKALNGGK
ncbi:MAG TPA: hypothetical protein DDY68_04920, partial [Porphyromonadaceae bacterium]|nr:hypothetical protein [Porphyromonadaceae bacterium]